MEAAEIPAGGAEGVAANDNFEADMGASESARSVGVAAAEAPAPQAANDNFAADMGAAERADTAANDGTAQPIAANDDVAGAGVAANDDVAGARAAANENIPADEAAVETTDETDPLVAGAIAVESEPPATPATAAAGGMPPSEPPVVPANDASPKDRFPDAAFLAALSQQQTDDKYGRDDWRRAETLTEPTMVWCVGDSGFVVFADTVARAGGDAQTYARLTQVAPGQAPGETDPTYRTKLSAYMLPAGTQIARSTTEASKTWGEGGTEQAFVPNFKAVTKTPMPQYDVEMDNREAVQLVVSNDKKSQ